MTADVAEIARSLTKAQRTALWNWQHPAYVAGLAPHDGFSRGGQAMQSLSRIGLACRVGRGMWKVNEKAIAVRAHLTQEQPR